MDGRKSLSLTCSFLFLVSTGCVSGGAQKIAATTTPPPAPPAAATPRPAAVAVDAPKADPKRTPRVIVAFAKFKEDEAKTMGRDPEQQFKLRDQARQLYQEAIKADGSILDAHRGLIRVYVDIGDFDRAQETVKKAMARFPKEAAFHYELAQMHNRKKEFPEAVKCLNVALEMDPENRQYITTLGFTLARSGQIDQGFAMLSRSMGVASAHYNIARMLLHINRTQEGMDHLRQAVALNPNLDNARQLLIDLEKGNQVNLDVQAGQ